MLQVRKKSPKIKIRGIQWSAVNKNAMFGLSVRRSSNDHYNTISFALQTYAGKLDIYESGKRMIRANTFQEGDTLSVVANSDDFIEYRVNNMVIYTSTRKPGYPLVADASLHDQDSGTPEASWAEGPLKRKAIVGCLMQMNNFNHVVELDDDGYVQKSTFRGNGWNAHMTSVSRFSLQENNKRRIEKKSLVACVDFRVGLRILRPALCLASPVALENVLRRCPTIIIP